MAIGTVIFVAVLVISLVFGLVPLAMIATVLFMIFFAMLMGGPGMQDESPFPPWWREQKDNDDGP